MPKVTELTASNSAANADLVVLVTNTTGSAITNKITIQNLATSLQSAIPSIQTLAADSGNVTANSTLFVTTIRGGDGIDTSASGNVLTISADSTVVTNNVFTQIQTDSGNLVSNSTSSFSVGVLGSNGVLTSASGANVSISFDPSTINTLTDVTSPAYSNASLLPANSVTYDGHFAVAGTSLYHGANGVFLENMDETHSGTDMAAHVKFTATANGTGAWNLSGGGTQGSDNETVYVYRGMTYKFDNAGFANHPLSIRAQGEATQFQNGVSNVGTSATYITIPQNATGNLEYYCTVHSNMVGVMVIV